MEDLILAYALIVIGLLLLAAELFLPTAGIIGVVGVAAVIAGVAIAFDYSQTQGIVSVVIVVVLIPSVGPLLFNVPAGRSGALLRPASRKAPLVSAPAATASCRLPARGYPLVLESQREAGSRDQQRRSSSRGEL